MLEIHTSSPIDLAEERRLSALQAYDILDTPSEAALNRLVARAARLFQVPIALISFFDEFKQQVKACYGIELTQIDPSISFCAYTLKSDSVFQIPDASMDPQFATNPLVTAEPHIRFYTGVPLRSSDDDRLGTLCLIDPTPRAALSAGEQLLLQELAEDVMRELELTRALKETQAALRGQQGALHQQRRSEAIISGILQSALDAIIVINGAGAVIEWNPAAEQIFGYTRREVLGQALAPLIIPEELRASHAHGMIRFFETGEGPVLGRRIEVPARRQDGQIFPCELTITPMEIDGASIFTAYLRDLTERKAADEAVITSHNLLRAVVDTVPESIFVKDLSGRYVMMNAAGANVIGLPIENILGKNDWELLSAETAIHSARQDALVWERGQPLQYEATVQLNDGTYRSFLSTRSVYRDAHGEVQGLIGAVVDVTASKTMERELQAKNAELEAHVQTRTKELEEARLEMLERLARAAEHRDEDTGEHVHRVARTSMGVAAELGLSQVEIELIGRASPLHDVGKIGVPDGILLKPGKLTAEEFEIVKTHTIIGASILEHGRSPLIQAAQEIALTHHERWDGSGYPQQLAGESIPLWGRIVAVADVFDALTSERPYKRAWTQEAALEEIHAQAGRQFDPEVVAAFRRWLQSQQDS